MPEFFHYYLKIFHRKYLQIIKQKRIFHAYLIPAQLHFHSTIILSKNRIERKPLSDQSPCSPNPLMGFKNSFRTIILPLLLSFRIFSLHTGIALIMKLQVWG